jgi:hyperosmotically inducible periplasmic protein
MKRAIVLAVLTFAALGLLAGRASVEKKEAPAPTMAPQAAAMPEPSADEALAARVKEALAADPELGDLDLQVTAKDGAVTIAGHPKDGEQLARIVLTAQKVPGVK